MPNFKKFALAAMAVFSFSASATTCRDVVALKDDLKGMALMQEVIAAADQDSVYDHVLQALERMQKARDLVLKIHDYRDLREMVIALCARHEQDVKSAIQFNKK